MDLTRAGVRLVYDEVGDGPETVVLLHGMACNRRHMDPVVEHLADRYRCINLDMRGHGDSDAPPDGYAMEDFTADLHHVVAQLGLDRPLVVGHSFGGTVALSYAVARSDAAASAVVLLDSGMRPNAVLNEDLGPFYQALRNADDPGFRRTVDEFVRSRLTDPLDGADLIDQIAADMGRCPRHVFLAMSRTVQGVDSAHNARACRIPALVVRSRHDFVDPSLPPTLGPNWHVAQVVGAGHFVQLAASAQVGAMIDRFLDVSRPACTGTDET